MTQTIHSNWRLNKYGVINCKNGWKATLQEQLKESPELGELFTLEEKRDIEAYKPFAKDAAKRNDGLFKATQAAEGAMFYAGEGFVYHSFYYGGETVNEAVKHVPLMLHGDLEVYLEVPASLDLDAIMPAKSAMKRIRPAAKPACLKAA